VKGATHPAPKFRAGLCCARGDGLVIAGARDMKGRDTPKCVHPRSRVSRQSHGLILRRLRSRPAAGALVVRDQSRLNQRIGDQCSAVALRAVTKIGAMLPKKGEVEILSRRGVQASAWEGLSHSRRGAGRRTKSQAAEGPISSLRSKPEMKPVSCHSNESSRPRKIPNVHPPKTGRARPRAIGWGDRCLRPLRNRLSRHV
jgi:hypothetical protein